MIRLVLFTLSALLWIPEVSSDAVLKVIKRDAPTDWAWGYSVEGGHGPEHWSSVYVDCGGKMQSPIDINLNKVLYDPNLELFDLKEYSITHNVVMELINKGGHTAEVMYSGKPLYITGGSLPDTYKLDQFHFHWGKVDKRGSEHSLNNHHYPMEMHIVHHQDNLDNSSSAASHPYGLAVLGYLFKVGAHNAKFDQLLNHFHLITSADSEDQHMVIPTFPLMDLLPSGERTDYYRYYGSLTTPPCYETVIWSVATEPIIISEDQLNIFRGLYDEERHHLVDDFRPTQELNYRVVTTTKKMGDGASGLVVSSLLLISASLLTWLVRL
ncbi:carbonic anhydrase 7 [Aplysia californica]|uniref:Carbonic anhydrase n=1 Tax=Aplysia californica TaxID=6500 RepID=A0ABM0JJR9_APLCA|nr:carbonic anhydrase 7 [Aplysia californica]